MKFVYRFKNILTNTPEAYRSYFRSAVERLRIYADSRKNRPCRA